MLDEYDFSQGVRNKYARQYQQTQHNLLPGVQFVTNSIGQKVGVLLDIQRHQHLWELHANQCSVDDIAFLMNSQGVRQAAFIEFESHLQLWQQIYDALSATST